MSVRVRFAPSPTGRVHIGNIRAAIFNWLFARHEDGIFLLRVEDTDRERSTPEAIATLLDMMTWLGLDADEPPLYQSDRRRQHLDAASRLEATGHTYHARKGGEGEALVFRIPWDADDLEGVECVGTEELRIHPDQAVRVSSYGVSFAGISKKGKPVPAGACLAGFRDLEVIDERGDVLFAIKDTIDDVLAGGKHTVEGGVCLRFTRRVISYDDVIKGRLSKPLDSMKDFVIVRSDGSPVFHLANVCDDISQQITHIIRGDDHVENTYRHIFLFQALGSRPPRYGHLPMIVNDAGKPYSKRDGDAFVGDFRDKGYLAEALFNYLTLLGWNPGDDREKMSREELVEAFTLDRVQQSAARMDLRKLQNLNGQYMSDMPFESFFGRIRPIVEEAAWGRDADPEYLRHVARLMQSRTKLLVDAKEWDYFFVDCPDYEAKAVRKFLGRDGIPDALASLRDRLAEIDLSDTSGIEAACTEVTEAAGIRPGKLNQPIRVAVTGRTVGAGVYETLGVLGRERVMKRLAHAVQLGRDAADDKA